MDTKLLKIRYAFDDTDLIARVCGAQMVHVTFSSYTAGTPEAQLADLVRSNPTNVVFEFMTEVIGNGDVQAAMVFDPNDRTVDSSAVPDSTIEFVVNATWATVSARLFGNTAP